MKLTQTGLPNKAERSMVSPDPSWLTMSVGAGCPILKAASPDDPADPDGADEPDGTADPDDPADGDAADGDGEGSGGSVGADGVDRSSGKSAKTAANARAAVRRPARRPTTMADRGPMGRADCSSRRHPRSPMAVLTSGERPAVGRYEPAGAGPPDLR